MFPCRHTLRRLRICGRAGGRKKSGIFSPKFVDFLEKIRIIDIRMDTHKTRGATKPGSLADLQGHKVIVGAKQLKKVLSTGQANQVFLAENADPALTEPIEAICLQNQIQYAWVPSMAELGRACGIDVGAAAAAVVE